MLNRIFSKSILSADLKFLMSLGRGISGKRREKFNRRPSQILVFILPWDPRMVFRSGTFGFNRNALTRCIVSEAKWILFC